MLRLAGRRILDAKRTAIKDAGAVSGGRTGLVGGDPGRVSRAQVDLWLDGLEAAREHPERLAGTATAFASAIEAMFITRRPTNEALDSVRVPVLVLWGTDDPLVDPTSLMQHARRPGWTPRPIDGVGHLLPVEAPDLCAQAVSQWLADSRRHPRIRTSNVVECPPDPSRQPSGGNIPWAPRADPLAMICSAMMGRRSAWLTAQGWGHGSRASPCPAPCSRRLGPVFSVVKQIRQRLPLQTRCRENRDWCGSLRPRDGWSRVPDPEELVRARARRFPTRLPRSEGRDGDRVLDPGHQVQCWWRGPQDPLPAVSPAGLCW